ncbi:MAG: HD family hydrolase [Rhizobiaceae bacterium]
MASADPSGARAWQRMLSGRRLDLIDPSPLDIEMSDIAHGLARVARWNGQTVGDHAFSVAQHSLLVEEIFRRTVPLAVPRDLLLALVHDAPEYVIGDMISPFKAIVGGEYKMVEQRLQRAIHLRFSLPADTPAPLLARIKKADHVAAYFEAVTLAGFAEAEAGKLFGRPRGFAPDLFDLTPWSATMAQARFQDRFNNLEQAMFNGASR